MNVILETLQDSRLGMDNLDLDDYQNIPIAPGKDDDLEKCRDVLKTCDKFALSCKKYSLRVVFMFGCWLVFAQTLLQNQRRTSFNKWMDENTRVKHSQGRTFMLFFRTFKHYPKIVESNLSFTWFKGKMRLIADYLDTHPDQGALWQ